MRPVYPAANQPVATTAVHAPRSIAAILLSACLLTGAGRAEDQTPVTATQLRHMTAAQFQAGIDKEGPQAFTARITKESDPHNWDEPNYDIILNHIATGNSAWLRIAGEIGPYTYDKDFNKGMNVALAYALLENPTGVLRIRLERRDDHFLNACMYPFAQPSEAFVKHYQQSALNSLKRIHDPALKEQSEDCRRELLSPPIEKASN